MAYDPVDWAVAERVAVRVARRSAPELGDSAAERLRDDFAELTPIAEQLVAETTGLTSLQGPARAEVTDRAGWIQANIRSFRRLLTPLLTRSETSGTLGRLLPAPLAKATKAAAGAELGAVLGWMSARVLGQYDLLFTEDAESSGDVVYYVGPNVALLERRHGFPPKEFRLWIAIHELTHRAQFTGVPWLHDHFLGLVDQGISIATPDPKALAGAIARMASEIRSGRNPLAESGLIGVLATPEQAEVLRSIQALMSLLEGHGDIVMNRAAADRIPGAKRFAETLQARRDSAGGVTKLIQQLIGMEAKLRQYKEGEQFVEAVEAVAASGGPDLLALVWEDARYLPTLDEVRDPPLWIDRVGGRSLEIA
ncbi:MAG: zinc-dependent metalloprotease [Acidimicrobiales bacterium]